jgi:hypothetical protein
MFFIIFIGIKILLNMIIKRKKILIILKRRHDYDGDRHSHIGLSTGLYNSAQYVNEMLNNNGIFSKLSVVTDNNDIDREVTQFNPTHVIIEALWVVPEKFKILTKLHPDVKWIIRLHSQLPFIANEGNAMNWIAEYASFPNVIIGTNSKQMKNEVRFYLKTKMNWTDNEELERVIYLPNYYPKVFKRKKIEKNKNYVDISCFGSVRPTI